MTENGSQEMIMPVQPMGYGGYPVMGGYGGWGNGFGFGGDWSAIIILFLFAMMGGGFGFGGGFGGFGGGLGIDFPWLLNGQQNINANTNAGFNQAATANTLGNIQTAINTGFSNAEVAACNRAMTDQALSFNNQIADLNRSFDAQTAITAGQTALSTQFADCCCENRLGLANLNSTILSENCADRAAISDGIRDLLAAGTANTQRILDMMCQDKIDAKNERIASLENQVNMQNLAASQAAQTAALVADNNAQTAQLIQRIAPYPIPAYQVGNPYGFYSNGYGWGNWGGWNGGCCGNTL